MSDTFTIGDTVQLKSGSPRMVVIDIGQTGLVYCQWTARDQPSIFAGAFPPAALGKGSGARSGHE